MTRTTARCGHPMEFHESAAEPRVDFEPVCGRPPHEGNRHLSRWAYERELARCRRNKAITREVERVIAEMSVPPASVSS